MVGIGLYRRHIAACKTALESYPIRASPIIRQEDNSVGVCCAAQLNTGDTVFLGCIGSPVDQVFPFLNGEGAVGSAVADFLSPIDKVAGVVFIVVGSADAPLCRACAAPTEEVYRVGEDSIDVQVGRTSR